MSETDTGCTGVVATRLSDAALAPLVAGVIYTVTVHEAFTASAVVQVVDFTNSAALVPFRVVARPAIAALPVLVTVTTCVGLDSPSVVVNDNGPAGDTEMRPALTGITTVEDHAESADTWG